MMMVNLALLLNLYLCTKFTEILVCLKNDSYTVTEGGDVTVGIQINRPAGTSFRVTLTPSPGTATGKLHHMPICAHKREQIHTDACTHMHAHTHTQMRKANNNLFFIIRSE